MEVCYQPAIEDNAFEMVNVHGNDRKVLKQYPIKYPALAITVLIIILQCISYHSGTELFLLCFGAIFYILYVFSLLITIFQKIDVLEDKLIKFFNITDLK